MADELGELIFSTARALRRRYAGSTVAWGVTPAQARALRVVSEHDGLRLSGLAEHLHIAPRSATEVVDALESRGLVERVPDPDDRRAICARITDDGRRTRELLDAARAKVAQEYFVRLSGADREALTRILGQLAEP